MDERLEMDGEPEREVKALATERGTDAETLADAALRRMEAKSQEPEKEQDDDSEGLEPELQ